jgi:leucyl aminopeptidase (aminopeptidase T)
METMDSKTWNGVQSLLDNYIKVQPNDHVAVLYTSDSSEPAAWVSAALDLRGIPVKRVWMAPLKDEGFPERLTAALPPTAEFKDRLVVLGLERHTMSHAKVLASALSKYKNSRVWRAISACPSLFSTALNVSPEELTARNVAILDRLMTANRLRVTTASGSDVSITLDSKHRWISNRGTARPGGIVILPAGEVATFPSSIAGKFVADFAFNANVITSCDSRLHNHPVTIWIEDGRAVKYECADPVISRFLENCFYTHCAYNVGELGFGTNFAVTDAIPMNSHINERRPGIHLGFGQHNQDPGVVGYQCSIHLDLIARGGLVWVDDDKVPLNLEGIVPSSHAHPTNSRDEDVFAIEKNLEDLEVDDCCGILNDEGGLRLFSQPGVFDGESPDGPSCSAKESLPTAAASSTS